MKIHEPQYSDVSFLFVYFNTNAYDPETLLDDLSSMPLEDQQKAKADLEFLIGEHRLGSLDFRAATTCTAKSEEAAHAFFKTVYEYAFEGGDEPSVTDYWDR